MLKYLSAAYFFFFLLLTIILAIFLSKALIKNLNIILMARLQLLFQLALGKARGGRGAGRGQE